MRISLLALGALALATGLSAQPAPHPTTNPKAFTGVFTGHANTSFPLGRTGGLIQYWRRGSDFAVPQPLIAIGSRPTRNLSAAATTLSVEVTMSNTPVTYLAMSGTFAQNLGPLSTVVFTRKPVNLPPLTGASDPDQPVAWLTFDVPFVFQGPHLIVQFDLGTAQNSVAIGRSSDAVPGTVATHLASAPSCGGSLIASGLGTVYTLTLAGAPANGAGLLLLSRENVRLAGAAVLPYRLDAVGMAGCTLGVDPLLIVAFVADGAGGMRWSFPASYSVATDPVVVHAQVMHVHAANPVGWGTTNTTHSVLGGAGLATYVYNYTVDGPVAQYGPYVTDRGAILLFRP